MKKLIKRYMSWYRTTNQNDLNYPTKTAMGAACVMIMLAVLAGIMLGTLMHIPYEVDTFYSGIGIISIMLVVTTGLFYYQLYKPLKAYETTHGSCGLGDEWLKKQNKSPQLKTKQPL